MSQTRWQGFSAWQLENEALRVVIVPQLGGRIASIYDKRASYEWLAGPTRPVRPRTYGDTFTEHDLSGWDEMFPTINMCPAPHDDSVQLPDHGEVWALPWEIVARQVDSITLKVAGRALPYTLTRQATLQADGLHLSYTVENHGPEAMPFLWAAHPLFNADEDTRIQLPAAVKQVVNVAAHPSLGAADRLLDWPEASLNDGTKRDLRRIGAATLRDYRKVYTLPHQPMASAALQQQSIQRELRLDWDSRIAPYLGIWVDEGTHTRKSTIALEPASGYYDSLAFAIEQGRVAQVEAGQQAHWSLTLTLAAL